MEKANRIAVELLPLRLVPFHFRQAADSIALETTVQRAAGQCRD